MNETITPTTTPTRQPGEQVPADLTTNSTRPGATFTPTNTAPAEGITMSYKESTAANPTNPINEAVPPLDQEQTSKLTNLGNRLKELGKSAYESIGDVIQSEGFKKTARFAGFVGAHAVRGAIKYSEVTKLTTVAEDQPIDYDRMARKARRGAVAGTAKGVFRGLADATKSK